jgi:hypothetical protein
VTRSSSDDLKAAADRFIKLAGSKRAAHRAIEAAEMTGKAGRPKGSPYLRADSELLFLAESLQNEYRIAHRTEPKGRTLIGEAFDLHGVIGSAERLGPNKRAVVERVASRPNLATIIFEAIRQHRPDLLQSLPDDAGARLSSTKDDPSKANFAMILFALVSLWGFVRRDPERFAALAANDPRAAELVRLLSECNGDVAAIQPNKTGGD